MPEVVYRGILLPECPAAADVKSVLPDYRAMLLAVMAAIADRYERTPGYPFIDTKLDLITGEDFDADDPLKGPNAVSGWIQGRGLESLAGHCRWMRRHNLNAELRRRLERIAADVLAALLDIRARNAGHLSFFMTPQGNPFTLDEEGGIRTLKLSEASNYGFSDLFSAKGMVAAARYLGLRDAETEALEYCRRVDDAIHEGRFVTDQISLDPKNPVGPRPGRHPHGAFMIQIGAAALLAEHGDCDGVEMGLRLIRHELQTYVNLFGRGSASPGVRLLGGRGRRRPALPGERDDPFRSGARPRVHRPDAEIHLGRQKARPGGCCPEGGNRRRRSPYARPAVTYLRGGVPARSRRDLQGVRPRLPHARKYRHALVEPARDAARRRVLPFDRPNRGAAAESTRHIQRLPQRLHEAFRPPGPLSDGLPDPRRIRARGARHSGHRRCGSGISHRPEHHRRARCLRKPVTAHEFQAAMRLEIKNLSLRYGTKKPLFEGVNLSVDSGDYVLIHGPSGSGKSSFLRLPSRLQEPASGEILLDGRSVRRHNVTELRRTVGYVQQTPEMAGGAVRSKT